MIISVITFLTPGKFFCKNRGDYLKYPSHYKINYNTSIKDKNKEKVFIKVSIPKINLTKNVYEINSALNHVDKNVTILPESVIDKKAIILAAHSGTNNNAYFNKVPSLIKDDLIYIYLKNTLYIYKVTDIYYITKTGYMKIPEKFSNVLILITCSVKYKNKQLIVVSTLVNNK